MDLEIKIYIRGNLAEMRLVDAASGGTLEKMSWEDKRDLSRRLFLKIESVLRKKGLSLRDIRKFSFDCDSPYFAAGARRGKLKMENIDSSGKCGFTAWQTGEVITEVLNFAVK